MQTQQNKPQETWIKILSKGIITIPKGFREKLGLKAGEIAKARMVGNQLIIEPREAADLRIYSKGEIEQMLKDDKLPKKLSKKVEKYWSKLS